MSQGGVQGGVELQKRAAAVRAKYAQEHDGADLLQHLMAQSELGIAPAEGTIENGILGRHKVRCCHTPWPPITLPSHSAPNHSSSGIVRPPNPLC